MVDTQASETKSVTVRSRRPREHLTLAEIERLMTAARQGRYGHRDATAILVAYRHGLRSSELVQWDQIDFVQKTIRITRVKNGTGATHYLSNSELRACAGCSGRTRLGPGLGGGIAEPSCIAPSRRRQPSIGKHEDY